MIVHHLNCGSLRPVLGRFLRPRPRRWVCHCLLIETEQGLVLVDSGLGTADIQNGRRMGYYGKLARPRKVEEETAIAQIRRMGFRPEDVRHILMTHLDPDHVGGLADFPEARVHLFGPEFVAALTPSTLMERFRYRSPYWEHRPKWVTHQMSGEQWFGFDAVRQIADLPPEILMIPLPGHTLGHCGVAVKTEKQWLFHAGDAYFFHGEMDPERPRCPRLLNTLQRFLQVDEEERLDNLERLRELARNHSDKIRIFCSHDPVEFAQLARPKND